MDKVIDLAMTKLFHLAEYVCNWCSFLVGEPAAKQEVVPTIRFTNEDIVRHPLVTKIVKAFDQKAEGSHSSSKE